MDIKIEKIFKMIESKVLETVESFFTITQNEVYAGAFWLFYCDFTVIHPPCFALNTSENLLQQPEKWLPPEWEFDVVDTFTDLLMPLYLQLSNMLKGKSEDIWEEVEAKNYDMYCSVSKKLTRSIRRNKNNFSKWNADEDFIIFVHVEDDEFYTHYLEQSVESMPVDFKEYLSDNPIEQYIQLLNNGASELSRSDEINYWIKVLHRVASGEEEKTSEWGFLATDHAIKKLEKFGDGAVEPFLRFVLEWSNKSEFNEGDIEETSMSTPTFSVLYSVSKTKCATENTKTLLCDILRTSIYTNEKRELWGTIPIWTARCLHSIFSEYPVPEKDENTNRLLNAELFL